MKKKNYNLYFLVLAMVVALFTRAGIAEYESFKEKYMDMSTVVDYEATEYGIMLYTDNGDGYYLEIKK